MNNNIENDMPILNANELVRYARNGRVRLMIAGTDCDGYSYEHAYTLSVAEAEAFAAKQYDWADGPIAIWPVPMIAD